MKFGGRGREKGVWGEVNGEYLGNGVSHEGEKRKGAYWGKKEPKLKLG